MTKGLDLAIMEMEHLCKTSIQFNSKWISERNEEWEGVVGGLLEESYALHKAFTASSLQESQSGISLSFGIQPPSSSLFVSCEDANQ